MLQKNKKGMTLIEMLLAIAIFTIGIQGFTMLFMKSWKSNAYIFEMGQASSAVSEGLNKMVKYIRMASQGDDGSYAIKSADDNDLIIFSDYDKDGIGERLHFYFQNGQIKMGITEPANGVPKTYPNGDQQTTLIADKIVNDSGTPVFYYFNKDYPGDQANNPVSTPANVAGIRLVKIFLKININPGRGPENIETQSFVELRNLNDYN